MILPADLRRGEMIGDAEYVIEVGFENVRMVRAAGAFR
jgi:hypothetical protein